MSLQILATPFAPPRPARDGKPRVVSADVLAAVLPGPGRDKLASGPVLAVTTGQQPGLFTGPLYTIHKALSALALARRLERERGVPVVPVFWVAGDDHDFREANHAWTLDGDGAPAQIVLRDRPVEAPQLPLSREPCGPGIRAALDRLAAALGTAPFAGDTLAWLSAAYTAERSLADACAAALNALLAPRGIAVFAAHHPAAKAAAADTVLRGLAITLPDGLSPVLVEGREGRDRLRPENGAFLTRRSGERFTKEDLHKAARTAPERLSPNVLLRPVVEAVLFPTVAYLAGPGELAYLPDAAPLYAALGNGVEPQTPVPRWSGVLIETRITHLLGKLGLTPEDFASPPGALEARVARAALPPEATAMLAELRRHISEDHARLVQAAAAVDPTLERSVTGARNAALWRAERLERRLAAAQQRRDAIVTAQIARCRAALHPDGRPQERVLTLATFLSRLGPSLLDEIEAAVAHSFGAE